jgi:uncharacterized membrane protein (UPF0127 family)
MKNQKKPQKKKTTLNSPPIVPPTRHKIIARAGKTITLLKVKHARTFFQRAKGLMGVEKEAFNYALIFHLKEKEKLNASIHMLFMKMPIDVLWLDEHQKIVDRVKNAQPWKLNYSPQNVAKYIIELPIETLQKINPKIGEKVAW